MAVSWAISAAAIRSCGERSCGDGTSTGAPHRSLRSGKGIAVDRSLAELEQVAGLEIVKSRPALGFVSILPSVLKCRLPR